MRNAENKIRLGELILDQIEKNLIVILIGGALIFSTFKNADDNTSRDISQINQKLDKLDAIYVRLCRLEANAQLGECK
jgi:predicted transcriptional regulator